MPKLSRLKVNTALVIVISLCLMSCHPSSAGMPVSVGGDYLVMMPPYSEGASTPQRVHVIAVAGPSWVKVQRLTQKSGSAYQPDGTPPFWLNLDHIFSVAPLDQSSAAGNEARAVPDENLRNDALAQAQAAFEQLYLKRDDSYVTLIVGSDGTAQRYEQYKDVTSQISADALTEADKLNGVVWRGRANFSAKAHRTLKLAPNQTDAGQNQQWDDWLSPPTGIFAQMVMVKRKGTWQVQRSTSVPDYRRKPSDLPGGL